MRLTRRRRLIIAMTCLLAGIAGTFYVHNADAGTIDYGSGPTYPAGISKVISTPAYTAVSDVLVVGDSITVDAYKALAAALPGKRLAVNAHSGRGTAESVTAVLAMPHVPPVVLMAVGSNDVPNPPVMAGQIKRLRDALEPRGIKVRWVTVQVVRYRGTAAMQLADQRNSGWVNAQIWAGCVAPCRVVDWAGFLAGYPGYRLPAYLRDGVHLSEKGKAPWGVLLAKGATS